MTDRELFETYKRDVYRLCYCMLQHRADAEDACQETFVRALLADRSGVERLKPWLLSIAANRCKSILARRRAGAYKEVVAFLLQRPRPTEAAEAAVARKETADELAALYGKLPVKIRSAMTLRYVNELSLAEIGEALDIPVGTVKSRLNKGLELLRKRMGGQADRWLEGGHAI
jgi:RNA polymerase sigma-70 factor (ECF subfamily)